MGLPFTHVIGSLGFPQSLKFRQQYYRLLSHRLAAAPIARPASYYFSTSGNDSTGDGSVGNPWQTIAKAQTTLNASSGNIALLFKCGDEWNELTGLDVSKANTTIGSWGTGNKPWFNRFSRKYSTGWSAVSGNQYSRAEVSTIGNVRYQTYDASKSTTQVLSRQANATDCLNTSNSWAWVSNVLYVNLGGTNPNTVQLEAVIANNLDGVSVGDIDGCRVDNIRVDGFGCDPANPHNPQAYQFKSRVSGANAVVFSNCEGYYGGTHIIAHYINPSAGGIATFYNCDAGFTTRNAGTGETIFNTYSNGGGQETIFHNCRAIAGTHPTGTGAWVQTGSSHYGHTAGGGVTAALTIQWNEPESISLPAGSYSCAVGGSYSNIRPIGQIDDARTFVVGETILDGVALPKHWTAEHVFINCRWRGNPANIATQGLQSSGAPTQLIGGIQINCLWDWDLTNQSGTGTRALYNALGTPNTPRMWHCQIDSNVTDNAFKIDFDTSTGASASVAGELINCVLNAYGISGGSAKVGFNNMASQCRGNAYFGFSGGSGTVNADDYGNHAAKLDLTERQTALMTLPPSSPLATMRDPGVQLEYDYFWRPRNLGSPTAGPIETIPGADYWRPFAFQLS